MKENTTKERNQKWHAGKFDAKRATPLGRQFSLIQDFANTAIFVEEQIKHLRLRDDSLDVVPQTNGRIHHDMWGSMKSVSHFNLGTALELMLKLLLRANGKGKQKGHKLTPLHDLLPPQIKRRLESTFQDTKRRLPGGCELIAFITKSQRPRSPQNRKLESLRDFLEYFDEDMKLWLMRYSDEMIDQQKWCHYLGDLTLFLKLMDRVMGRLDQYIDSEPREEYEGTGTGARGNKKGPAIG